MAKSITSVMQQLLEEYFTSRFPCKRVLEIGASIEGNHRAWVSVNTGIYEGIDTIPSKDINFTDTFIQEFTYFNTRAPYDYIFSFRWLDYCYKTDISIELQFELMQTLALKGYWNLFKVGSKGIPFIEVKKLLDNLTNVKVKFYTEEGDALPIAFASKVDEGLCIISCDK